MLKLVKLHSRAKVTVMAAMSTKFREVIWGGQIMRAKIHVKHTRPEAQKAASEADRAEAHAWSIQMEGLWRASAAVHDYRPVHPWRTWVVGDRMQSLQDASKPAAECDPPTA